MTETRAKARKKPASKASTAKKITKTKGTKALAAKKATSSARAPRAAKRPTRSRTTRAAAPTAQERHRMVAEAAFRRAVAYGVRDRDPLRDWLEAEAEVNARLAAKSSKVTRRAKTTSKKAPVKRK